MQALAAPSAAPSRCTPILMDEALALPTEKAARIALRTQQILAEESGVSHVQPIPLGRLLHTWSASPPRWRTPVPMDYIFDQHR